MTRPLSLRSVSRVAPSSLLTLVVISACGSNPEAAPPEQAGGNGAVADSGAAAAGGFGGAFEDAGTAGSAGSDVELDYQGRGWKIVATAAGCTVGHMQDIEAAKPVFHWKPCHRNPGCEVAQQTAWQWAGPRGTLDRDSYVREVAGLGAVVTLLPHDTDESYVLTTDATGRVLAAYGVESPEDDQDALCRFTAAAPSQSRVAARFVRSGDTVGRYRHGGLAVDLAKPAVVSARETTSEVGQFPGCWMLSDRYWYGCLNHDEHIIAVDPTSDQIWSLTEADTQFRMHSTAPTVAGDHYFFAERRLVDAWSPIQTAIRFGSGTGAPTDFLASDDADWGSPAPAGSHIGFLKGISRYEESLFRSVEIWSSPLSTNPAELQPSKVDTWTNDAGILIDPDFFVGGNGYLAIFEPSRTQFRMYDLVTGSKRVHRLGSNLEIDRFLGFTDSHLWILASPKYKVSDHHDVYRFALPPR